MALVPMRLLLDHAAENNYGIPAFNVNNLEQILAIMQAANETDSPIILQASRGARSYAGENFLRHLILAAAETYPHLPIASRSVVFGSDAAGKCVPPHFQLPTSATAEEREKVWIRRDGWSSTPDARPHSPSSAALSMS